MNTVAVMIVSLGLVATFATGIWLMLSRIDRAICIPVGALVSMTSAVFLYYLLDGFYGQFG